MTDPSAGVCVVHVCVHACACVCVFAGFPLFWTDKIPRFFQVLVYFQVFFSFFLKYDFQVVLNIDMKTY